MLPLKSPGDSIDFQMTWANISPATLSSVTHTVPTDVSKVSESNTTTTSTVRVSGAKHGKVYQIVGTATLSSGRTLERTFPLTCFYGAG